MCSCKTGTHRSNYVCVDARRIWEKRPALPKAPLMPLPVPEVPLLDFSSAIFPLSAEDDDRGFIN